MPIRGLALCAALALPCCAASIADLASRPDVGAAIRYIDQHKSEQLAEWIRITEIPAPSRQEQKRGAYIRAEMEKLGLRVSMDEMGNIEGVRKGSAQGPALVIAVHYDTVFPLDTPIKVRQEGGRLYAPGVFDNSCSVANMLAAVRALNAANVQTQGDVIFLATVQEEIGLFGMEHWLKNNRARTGMLIAMDGGLPSVNYGALGIRWLKLIFTSEGSHTLSSIGKPNPALAIANAIQRIYKIPLPKDPFLVYNIGMIGGGKVQNAISQESFFTVDLRSTDQALIEQTYEQIRAIAETAAREERVGFRMEVTSDGRAGGTREELEKKRQHPIVQTAVDVLTYLEAARGNPIRPAATGSTDANVGVRAGVPSISVGRAYGGGQHTLAEYADIESAYLGTRQLILLIAALAGV